MSRLPLLVSMLAVFPLVLPAAGRWRLQFFHDDNRSTFRITSLKFPSARRGVAVGALVGNGKPKPSALVTSDGGESWSFVRLKELPLSLFFLNETIGWMVTVDGLWKTEEAGRSWRKLKAPDGIQRVYFRDENRGWAAGLNKGAYETSDGGRKWTRLAALDEVNSRPSTTSFTWITFVNDRHGVIAGGSDPRSPPRRLPEWLEPERAERRRQWPSLTIMLETRDGGQTWKPSTSSLFGRITRFLLSPDGRGLGLVEFHDAFDWPSEVFRIDWTTGKSTRAFREEDRAVTDIALLPGGPAYLAAVESPGKLRRSPIPGKLRILKSENLAEWHEMEVDYRATARRAILSAFDPGHIWVATDTGMILKLESAPDP